MKAPEPTFIRDMKDKRVLSDVQAELPHKLLRYASVHAI